MSNADDLDKKVLKPFQEIFAAMGITGNLIKLESENFSLPELTSAERKALSEGKPIDPKILETLMGNLAPLVPFAYKEHPVIVYIRDQYLTRADYKRENYHRFHLCFCQHLRSTREKIVMNRATS